MNLILPVIICTSAVFRSPPIEAVPHRIVIDQTKSAYEIINSTIGNVPETPDCSHPEFGPHVTHEPDSELGRRVFAFTGHPQYDNDRCENHDRQRIEIDIEVNSPEYLRLLENDIGVYSWNFKLKKGIQMSPEFFHIHQQKSIGGNDSMPFYTLSLEKDYLGRRKVRLVYWPWNERQARRELAEVPIELLEDNWVHVYERIKMSHSGSLFFEITRMADGKVLMSYKNDVLDNWRDGTHFCRPKWGLYRNLFYAHELRNETIHYDGICIAKATTGTDDCTPRELCAGCPIHDGEESPDTGSAPPRLTLSAASLTAATLSALLLQALRH